MQPESHSAKAQHGAGNGNGVPISEIVDAVKSVRHGYVQVVIQDGKVIQIEIHEKRRLQRG